MSAYVFCTCRISQGEFVISNTIDRVSKRFLQEINRYVYILYKIFQFIFKL